MHGRTGSAAAAGAQPLIAAGLASADNVEWRGGALPVRVDGADGQMNLHQRVVGWRVVGYAGQGAIWSGSANRWRRKRSNSSGANGLPRK
jgi:hypothetical protein